VTAAYCPGRRGNAQLSDRGRWALVSAPCPNQVVGPSARLVPVHIRSGRHASVLVPEALVSIHWSGRTVDTGAEGIAYIGRSNALATYTAIWSRVTGSPGW